MNSNRKDIASLSPRVTLDGNFLPLMNSYAQNFEDVMLRRALQDISGGFYIDAGAFDPNFHSITKYFYDEGWSGINIEPHPDFYKKLCIARERDINLNNAVSDFNGQSEFQIVEHTGMSSLLEEFPEFVKMTWAISKTTITVSTLASIINEYAQNRVIDFLKIDVEGEERAALLGACLKQNRPRIIVVEATKPMSQEPAWEHWEPDVLASGYNFVWFDGLNRFYVRDEDSERLAYFRIPPCCFDCFKLVEVNVPSEKDF